jgi:COP9 signalosome complex subunit 6
VYVTCRVSHQDRLPAYSEIDKDVHKIPALELVGWFTLCPETGPTAPLLPIHVQIMQVFNNESALLLAFHPSAISAGKAPNSNGKLPLTIFETAIESDHGKADGAMQVDGEDYTAIKFRPVSYTIETDETEMIAIDYVAKGAGSAAAVHVAGEGQLAGETNEPTEDKGKKRADEADGEELANGSDEAANPLSTEEDDQIAGITTRLNSVRMLLSRLSLLTTFIRSQSPSYLNDPNTPLSKTSPDPAQLPHLRDIQALLTRLSLLTPPADDPSGTASTSADTLTSASLSQSNDVALSTLLAILGQDVQGLSELGRKFASVEQERLKKGKGKVGMGTSIFGSGGEFEGSKVGSSMMV